MCFMALRKCHHLLSLSLLVHSPVTLYCICLSQLLFDDVQLAPVRIDIHRLPCFIQEASSLHGMPDPRVDPEVLQVDVKHWLVLWQWCFPCCRVEVLFKGDQQRCERNGAPRMQ